MDLKWFFYRYQVISMLFLSAVLLICCSSDSSDSTGGYDNQPPPLGLGICVSDTDIDPLEDLKKLGRNQADNTFDVRFVVVNDPHFWAERRSCKWGYDSASDKVEPLARLTNNINTACDWLDEHKGPTCQGVVLPGDLTRGSYWYHSLVLYRSLYEHDRDFNEFDFDGSWKDDAFPKNEDKIKFPVYPGIGNHDDGTEQGDHGDADGNMKGYVVQEYIRGRIQDSAALFQGKDEHGNKIENYFENRAGDIYAWEWGSFHFINMGLWAFYGGCIDCYDDSDTATRSKVNWDKVRWLEDHFAQIGKEKVIVLFQHFGWDSFSQSSQWWGKESPELLLDVICDREAIIDGSDGLTECYDPYNVVALFSGHEHDAYPQSIAVKLGLDEDGNDVILHNYRGYPGGYHAEKASYFHVRLNLYEGEFDADGNLEGEMVVNLVRYDGKDRYATEPWKTEKIRTKAFLRFDQGEPNNSGEEDCAVFKRNGRYNDYSCNEKHPALCWDEGYRDWRLTQDSVEWRDGPGACSDLGLEFIELRNLEQQLSAMKTLADEKAGKAWINYTDKLKEGTWQAGNRFTFSFDSNEPNNGEEMFEKGWGANCLRIKPDLTFDDIHCEDLVNYYMCRDDAAENGWTVKSDPEVIAEWRNGYLVCGEDNFIGPDPNDGGELDAMVEAARAFYNNTSDAGAWAIWLPFSDLDEEGVWTGEKPWIADQGGWKTPGEPNDGGNGEDCALVGHVAGLWYDVPCEHYNDNRFACRNHETGEWRISESSSRNWMDGFQACRDLGLRYYFAAPIREEDNNTLISMRDGHEIWLNYTDTDSDAGGDFEGFWRHGFWKPWKDGEPNNNKNNENCVYVRGALHDLPWNDADCATKAVIPCRWRIGSAYEGSWVEGKSWGTSDEARRVCSGLGNQNNYQFTYPYCPSENEALFEKIEGGQNIWINMSDTNHEGYFVPWD